MEKPIISTERACIGETHPKPGFAEDYIRFEDSMADGSSFGVWIITSSRLLDVAAP